MKNIIHPILLAGGSGTRLWPLSRKSYPKQFSDLFSGGSMLKQTVQRFKGSADLQCTNPLIITNKDFRFIVREQVVASGTEPDQILIEPEGKNTAPAILAASLYKSYVDPDAVLLVSPTDHVMKDTESFYTAIIRGLDAVNNKKIVTFGIVPDRPETGYGYMEVTDNKNAEFSCVRRFKEKPSHEEALHMLTEGNFLWNSGMFMFKAKELISAFEKHDKISLELVKESLLHSEKDLDFIRLSPEPWAKCDAQSIDYAIMEKIDNIVSVPLKAGWSDLGDWLSVWREQEPDKNGNVTYGSITALDCHNSLLSSPDNSIALAGIGLKDLVVVAMSDAVLVADKGKTQEVKKVVDMLRINGVSQAENFPVEYRPWGWVEHLTMTEKLQIKRVFIKPGASISLQSHVHRTEHWVVLEGTVMITVNGKTKEINANQSLAVGPTEIHELRNETAEPVILIELQTGDNLNTSDVIRYQ